jgi:hypothetical protein
MTTTKAPRRFTTTAADEGRLEATIVALEAHGFGVEVAEGPDAAGPQSSLAVEEARQS